jgi:ribosomal protein L3
MDRCRRDEIDPKNNDRIFRDMFESYLDELNDYKTAEAATVTYELQYGFYKSADAAQKGCEDPLKPADIAKITADLSALNVQLAIEEAQARRETEQRAIAEKREKQAEELKKENEIMEIRKNHKRITQEQNLADREIQSAETKRAYDSMFPTNITEKGRLEADQKN